MTTKYKLTTLRDVYEKVPAEKLALCMREIAEGMEHAKALEALMSAAGESLDHSSSVSTIWPDECEWIDDGKEDKTIEVFGQDSGEHAFTYKVTKSIDSGAKGAKE